MQFERDKIANWRAVLDRLFIGEQIHYADDLKAEESDCDVDVKGDLNDCVDILKLKVLAHSDHDEN